jgi:hypothetical protein
MIVNSKLWSPPFSGRGRVSNETMQSTTQTCTSNVFGGKLSGVYAVDKREELTKILKKRLNYIHQ